ncbi:MAG TPA: hypothetical protein VGU20_25225 [Stellaceae bacterium]|nr:hypothetical protein [Stellaceae bacterium]
MNAERGDAPSSPVGGRIGVGYLLSVTAATLAFLLHTAWHDIVSDPMSRAPIFDWIWRHAPLWVFLSVIFSVYAFFTTAWPFAATLMLARRYGITSLLYYLVCGAVAGFLLSLIVVVPPWVHDLEHDNTFLEEWIRAGRAFAAYGACGGLAFWCKAGRFIAESRAARRPSAT